METLSDFRLSFVGIGPMKTASSWIDAALRRHPDVYLPDDVKETLFFTKRFDLGWSWYEHYFKNRSAIHKCGEVAPTLFRDQSARQRLLESFPETKIIISLRDPVERTYSHFLHARATGVVPNDFFDAIRIRPSILEAGRYHVHVPHWEYKFPRKQIHFIFSEEIANDPRPTWVRMLKFLEVEEIPLLNGFQKVGAGVNPRSPFLGRIAKDCSSKLRKLQLDNIVNFAKRNGGKRLLFKKREIEQVPDKVHSFLEDQHKPDRDLYNSRISQFKS